jgi:uncharacterized damage-inducible protein DinB
MYKMAEDFLAQYAFESLTTAGVLNALTDASLSQAKMTGHSTLGEIAWHVATAPCYMAGQVGLDMPEMGYTPPEHMTADMIRQMYNDMSDRMKEQAAKMTPADMAKQYKVWDMDWTTATMLGAMLSHEIHHRGQMSVLMRQAGLKVPSIYGPNHEETMEMMKKMQAAD